MQTSYKGFTAARIAKYMERDKEQPATYWATISGIPYRVTPHRDTVQMANNTMASTLVLETPDKRVVLRWSGKPERIVSATIAR